MARPFHFTTNPASLWTIVDFINPTVWTQAGTLLNAGNNANSESLFIRDADTSDDATVEARMRFDTWNIDFQGFGVVSNFKNLNQYYLFVWLRFAGGDVLQMFVFNFGFTLLSSKSKTYTPSSFENIKIKSTTNGPNKDLEGFINGVLEISTTTGIQYLNGQAGMYTRIRNTADNMDADWWAMDLDIQVDSVSPSKGLDVGGETVGIAGSDIGDGSLAEFGGGNASSNVATPNLLMHCVTPPHEVGLVDVKVKFGTAGDEEYSGVLINGYTYFDIPGPLPRAIIMGVDITQFVESFGGLEQIKDVLLARATLLTSEMTIRILSFRDFAKPKGIGSLFAGLEWYNQVLQILQNNVVVYEGFVKNIRTNPNSQTADIVSENILKKPAESVINAAATLSNPSQAMLRFLRLVLDDSRINVASFNRAGDQAASAGATIDYTFSQGDNVTVLEAIRLVSDLSAISVFVVDNKIIARPFVPFQGNESGLKFEINDAIVREWGPLEFDNSSFNNKVAVGYPVDQFEVQTDEDSIRANGNITREIQFPADDKVVASNLTSARFFARLYLARASKRKAKLTIAGGKEFEGTVLGDRFPVSNPDLGLVRFPMECIEVHQTLDSDEIELFLAQVFQI